MLAESSYDFLGTRVRVRSAIVDVVQYWNAVFAEFRTVQDGDAHVTVCVQEWPGCAPSVTVSEGFATLAWDGHEPLMPPLRRGGMDRWLYLQASAFGRDGQAVLVLGGPGSGKTTIALAAVARGASLVADDVVPLDPGDLLLLPFPKSLRLRQEVLGLLGIPRSHPSVAPFRTRSGAVEWRARPTELIGRRSARTASDVAAIVLLDADERDGTARLRRLSDGETFEALVRHLDQRPRSSETATDALVRLCRRVPGYALTAGPPPETAALLDELLA
jgi:hypothetical protein